MLSFDVSQILGFFIFLIFKNFQKLISKKRMDYKTKKELFVSNLQGTTAFEICVLTSVAPVRRILFFV